MADSSRKDSSHFNLRFSVNRGTSSEQLTSRQSISFLNTSTGAGAGGGVGDLAGYAVFLTFSGDLTGVIGVAGFSIGYSSGFSIGISTGFSTGFSTDFSTGFKIGF